MKISREEKELRQTFSQYRHTSIFADPYILWNIQLPSTHSHTDGDLELNGRFYGGNSFA